MAPISAAYPMTDHDLLVRIDEQMKGLRTDLQDVKTQAAANKANTDAEWKEYKGVIDLKVVDLERAQSSMERSRAQIFAISGFIALVVGWLVSVFKH